MKEISNYNEIDSAALKRVKLYCQRAPKYLQDIASHYDKNISVFINWDVKNVNTYGLSRLPDENDSTEKISIFLNPYTFAWQKKDIEISYNNRRTVDVREVVLWVLLHELGHAITRNTNDSVANEWMIKQMPFVRKNFKIPRTDNEGKTIEDLFISKPKNYSSKCRNK